MTEVVDLNSKRPPVVYTITIVHHYDDTLEFRIEDVADDERSREAVMSAFRRISGADDEIEKLRTDLRHAVFADGEYAKEMERQNVTLREENARLREETDEWEKSHNTLVEEIERLRALVIQLEDYKDALRRDFCEENARLREALKPFADIAKKFEFKDDSEGISGVMLGDLRAAVAAIREGGEG